MCKLILMLYLFGLNYLRRFGRNHFLCALLVFHFGSRVVKTMIYAKFDYICEFLDIYYIERSNSLCFVLLRNVLLDVAVHV